MSTLLNNELYAVTPDNLIYDSKHPIDVKNISVAANQGTVKKGTVLALTNTDEYLVFGTALVAPQTSSKANCIVTEDVDTTSTGTTVNLTVYISGSFNKNALLVKTGSSLAASDIEDLRAAGIFVSSSMN